MRVINLVQSASSTSLIEPTPSTSIAFDQESEKDKQSKRENSCHHFLSLQKRTDYYSQDKIPKLNLDHQKKTKKQTTTNGNDNCLYCLEKYGTTRFNEGWVQCIECKGWAHEGCTGYDSEELDDFVCMGCIAAH
ncbi:hypothetical protein PYW08_006124 [Mythimna loreyi]|uniref:Uncharacterized protein n=1 Tax=Mythimna loreyi TaxID=667449 RepID=A0ACC2QPB7_9NEOP|nr:hypothetical protein PYW08_006124 [Mythimna loreyi]